MNGFPTEKVKLDFVLILFGVPETNHSRLCRSAPFFRFSAGCFRAGGLQSFARVDASPCHLHLERSY